MGNQSIPSTQPLGNEFAGANKTPGDVFGDSGSRPVPSSGANLSKGLSEQMSIANVDPASLGEGRNDTTGKPQGPQKGPVNNTGGSAKLQWG